MKNKHSIFIILIALCLFSINSCIKDDETKPEKKAVTHKVHHKPHHVKRPLKYFSEVKVIIQNNCFSCHSSTGSWSGRPVVFDTDQNIASAYASIKSSVADPATFYNKRMPQGSTLSSTDIDIIVKWFNRGGKISD